MLSSTSNIRAFVQWSENIVFAGEEVECQITFKNTAANTSAPRQYTQPTDLNGFPPEGDKLGKTTSVENSTVQQKNRAFQTAQTTGHSRGHRSALSLNVPSGSARLQRASGLVGSGYNEPRTVGRSHRRSVSIISLGISERARDEAATQPSANDDVRRPARGHTRSSSLQIVPRRSVTNGTGPLSAPFPQRSTTQPSPLFRTTLGSEEGVLDTGSELLENSAANRQNPGTISVPNTPSTHIISTTRRKGSATFSQNFKFPASTSPMPHQRSLEDPLLDDEVVSPRGTYPHNRLLSPRLKDDVPVTKDQAGSSARIISPTINGETPRSSGEFYSLSNNSTDTLASEYIPQQPARAQLHAIHTRRISNIAAISPQRAPETLMMGYAQIHGSFNLDGSLINQAPFEEVKRRGVLGGQGGGVIGVETSKRDSGLLRGFGWGNIGNSISGLIGSGELSSIKDMRGIASSKSVPLLTTNQSILFVDLRLAPGESRSYRYTFKLPRGLPPSHRGKAIKISYNLVIGIQRPGGAKGQQVRCVEVPFRVLGSVNEHGELLGHDLMSPCIIMRDQARVECLENNVLTSGTSLQKRYVNKKTESTQSNLEDFLAYVEDLLARPRQNSNLGLLSPTEPQSSHRPSSISGPSSAREAVDLAILRSNLTTDTKQSANRFEIARNGQRVAVVMLTRPAYRLGETVTTAVDFTGAEIPCYALHFSLETSERIDGALALRSDASVHRVTRKIHSSYSESTLFARRLLFYSNIPTTATPSFITSGVSLEWKISMEFVTARSDDLGQKGTGPGTELLEEVAKDERGIVFAAAEDIGCESFEITVPIRVYGALVGPVESDDSFRGLVV